MNPSQYLKLLAACLALMTFASIAMAQKGTSVVKCISLARGRTTAVLQGTIKRGISHDYLLRARGGQGMALHLASGGDVGFEIITPAGQYLSSYKQDWSGSLPQSGDYRINVLPPTTTNAPARYTLEVTIR